MEKIFYKIIGRHGKYFLIEDQEKKIKSNGKYFSLRSFKRKLKEIYLY
jgi:hypothetical protein